MAIADGVDFELGENVALRIEQQGRDAAAGGGFAHVIGEHGVQVAQAVGAGDVEERAIIFVNERGGFAGLAVLGFERREAIGKSATEPRRRTWRRVFPRGRAAAFPSRILQWRPSAASETSYRRDAEGAESVAPFLRQGKPALRNIGYTLSDGAKFDSRSHSGRDAAMQLLDSGRCGDARGDRR